MPELTFLSAVAMAEQVSAQKLSPVELLEAHLHRIERLNPELNAFVQIDAEGARRQARAAEAAVTGKQPLGPLHGVPVSIKSSIDVKGVRCEAGTKLRAGLLASRDAPLVSRLRNAGAIILGTTNTPELLMAWETDNLLYGRTNNPWDLSRTPGGSSGGEAAAIAAGCSAGGVGSDGGGSIRVPAHFSGICGLKPTPGRIPASGHFPTSVGPFALLGVVGPMARTVADLKVLFEVMQGPDDGDVSSAPVPVRWPDTHDLKKLRIGYFEDDGQTPVTAETRAAVHTAAEALQRSGFDVRPWRPDGLEQARRLWWQFFGVAGGMLLRPMIKGRESELSRFSNNSWSGRQPSRRTRRRRYSTPGSCATHFAWKSFRRCANIPSCFVPWRPSPPSAMASAVGTSMGRPYHISMPGVTASGLICSALRRRQFRSENRTKACPSACRS